MSPASKPAQARRRIADFEAQAVERLRLRGEPAPETAARLLRRLAGCAALPVLFDPGFIHLLRLNFFSRPPDLLSYRAENDLLLSGLCHLVDERYYEIEPDLRQALLVELAHEPGDLLRRTAALLWEYTARRRPWGEAERLERAQRLTALNFLDPERARAWIKQADRLAGRSGEVERDWLVAMDREIKAAAPVHKAREKRAAGSPAQAALLISAGRDLDEIQAYSHLLSDDLGLRLDWLDVPVDRLALDEIQTAIQRSLDNVPPDSAWLFIYLGGTIRYDGGTALRLRSDPSADLPLSWLARAFVHSPASHALLILSEGFYGFPPGLERELARSGESKSLSLLAPDPQRMAGEQYAYRVAVLNLLSGLGLAHDPDGLITTSGLERALEVSALQARAGRLLSPSFVLYPAALHLNRPAGEFSLRLPVFLEPETLRLAASPDPVARRASIDRLLREDLPKHPERRPLAVALARGQLQPPDPVIPQGALWPTGPEPDPGVRSAAAQALGQIGGQAAARAVLLGLGDPDPAVRPAAARALGDALARRLSLGEIAPPDSWLLQALQKALESAPPELLPDLVYAAAATGEGASRSLALHKAGAARLVLPWVGPDLSFQQLRDLVVMPFNLWVALDPQLLVEALRALGKNPLILQGGPGPDVQPPTIERPLVLPLTSDLGSWLAPDGRDLSFVPEAVQSRMAPDLGSESSPPVWLSASRIDFFLGFDSAGDGWSGLEKLLSLLPADSLSAPLLAGPGTGLALIHPQRPLQRLDLDPAQALGLLRSKAVKAVEIDVDSLPLFPLALVDLLDAERYPLVRLRLRNPEEETALLDVRLWFGDGPPAEPVALLPLLPGQEMEQSFLPALPPDVTGGSLELHLRVEQVSGADLPAAPEKRPTKKASPRPQPDPPAVRRLLLEQRFSIDLLPPERFPLAVKSVDGAEIELTDFLAVYVTPQAPGVQALLSEATRLHPIHRMQGYAGGPAGDLISQARALYAALAQTGMRFTTDPLWEQSAALISTLLRLPDDCLARRQATRLEAALLFASLLEAAGLEPLVGLLLDDAFAAYAKGGRDYEPLDPSLAGYQDFDAACKAGMAQVYRVPQLAGRSLFGPKFFRIAYVKDCRQAGIQSRERDPARPLAPAQTMLTDPEPAAAVFTLASGLPPEHLSGLKSREFRSRAAAVRSLADWAAAHLPTPEVGNLAVPVLADMLADDYPLVRVAAIQALERLQPNGEWRAKLVYECYVPAGVFVMGDDGKDWNGKPVPKHEVPVDAFYIGKYPVTNAEYARFMADQGRPFEIPSGKERHPVVAVDLDGAQAYASWAGVRLPSEAEWEKAASWEAGAAQPASLTGRLLSAFGRKPPLSGRKRKYPWGDQFDPQRCNTFESQIGSTTPAGRYSPAGDSPYGCADMTGNIWEWTRSLYWPYPYRVDDGREAFVSLRRVSFVLRGGAFSVDAAYARCACRIDYSWNLSYDSYGFRVGLTAPSPNSDALESVL